MDDVVKADFRLAALSATDRLQTEIGFDDRYRPNIENTIFKLMRDAYMRRPHRRKPQRLLQF